MSDAKYKILHVFSSLELGGTQRRFIAYLDGSKAEFEHLTYAMDGCYDALSMIPGAKPLFDGKQVVTKGNTLKAIRECRKLIKHLKPDLLISYNWGAIEWVLGNSLLPLCPTLHIQDGFTKEEQEGELSSRRMLRRIAYNRCTKVVVPSRTLEKIARESWKIPATRLLFIPNGIDLDRFSGAAEAQTLTDYGLTPDDKIVGTVAGLRPEKNIGRLIEAFSKIETAHPEAKLVIVGDGIGMAALRMLAETICGKGRVIFTGSLPQPEKIVPAFTLFALSSDTEQMPLSVLEAMACGLPIVSTNVGDIYDMVSADNQLFIEGKSADCLADNIDVLLSNAPTRIRLGQANKNKAQTDYSLQVMVERYDQLFATPK